MQTLNKLIKFLVDQDPQGALSLEQAKSILEKTILTPADYESFAEENDNNYNRNRLFLGENIELLILTWKPGQTSKIHDHQGSVCCIKVIEGQGVEIRFKKSRCGKFLPLSSEEIPENTTTSSFDNDIHLIANPETERLVTLHLYSPPLKKMNIYGPELTLLQ